ncbi:MAG: iron ABC transporter permease [Clostridia bacterium]|nr:iron ABC transporter permease [Clostridia bacterium]
MLRKLRHRYLNFWTIVTLCLIVFFVVALILPVAQLFLNSFKDAEGAFSLESYKTFFTKKYYYQALQHSLWIGVVSTLVSTGIGVFLAYIVTRYNVWGKNVLKVLFLVGLMSPPFIGAYSWIILLGRGGFITNLLKPIGIKMPPIYGKTGIILVFSLHLSCYVFRYVSAAFKGIDSSLEEASENLGASKFMRLFTVTLPVVIPTITSVMIIVFMRSLADFGTPLLIGEGYKTMPVMVYNAYLGDMGGNKAMAGTISAISVFLSIGLLLVQKAYIARKNYRMSNLRPPKVIELHGWKRFLVTLPVVIWVFIALLPQLTVIVTSFLKMNGPMFSDQFSFSNYQIAFKSCGKAILHTFTYSTIAIVFVILIGTFTSYVSVRRRKQGGTLVDTMAMLPMVIPGAVFGICYIMAFNKPPIVICGTAIVMVLALVVRRLPNTIRSSVGVLESLDPSLDEASISLGVPALKTFFVITARLMVPGIAAGAVLSWISSINEISSSLLLYAPKTVTMPVAIYTFVSQNDYGQAAAMGTIMTVAIVIALTVVSRMTRKSGGII